MTRHMVKRTPDGQIAEIPGGKPHSQAFLNVVMFVTYMILAGTLEATL